MDQHIDRLIDATIRNDWDEVRGLSRQISCNCAADGHTSIAQAASRLCTTISERFNEWEATHGVVQLAELCVNAR